MKIRNYISLFVCFLTENSVEHLSSSSASVHTSFMYNAFTWTLANLQTMRRLGMLIIFIQHIHLYRERQGIGVRVTCLLYSMLECTALIMTDHMFDARPVIRKTYYIKKRQLSEAKKTVTLIVSASNKQ